MGIQKGLILKNKNENKITLKLKEVELPGVEPGSKQ